LKKLSHLLPYLPDDASDEFLSLCTGTGTALKGQSHEKVGEMRV
jgi:hypothetical protein